MRLSILFSFMVLISTKGISQNSSWTKLLNGKDLTGWDTYLGPSYDTTRNDWDHTPLGLNTDPAKVFSVVTIDGHAALRISGERFGGISTQKSFKNYHLKLEFKWGEAKSHPKKKKQARQRSAVPRRWRSWSRLWVLDAFTGISTPGR